MIDLRVKKYEFECCDSYMADKFLKVLNMFHTSISDIYIAYKDMDFSQIQFRCDRDTRLQIEYVFRRISHMGRVYLMELEHEVSSVELTGDNGYAIF